MLRKRPALCLFLIAPLVAEFLLGNLSITALPSLLVLAPLYGGGALLVREAVRRSGRGWPSILALGLAFAVLEEAFMTQTLFNPDYLGLGLRLLQPAHVGVLGMGAWWTLFVLTLHTVWSIATSIALAEALVPERRSPAWLGRTGLVATVALFGFGAIATTQFTLQHDRFVASPAQFAGAALVVALLVAVAYRMPRPRPGLDDGRAPAPWLLGAIGLAAGSAFLLVPPSWGWGAVAAYLVLDLAVIASVFRWSRRAGFGPGHELALAAGAALAYAWHAFPQEPVVGAKGGPDLIGNATFALALLALLAVAARRGSGQRS